ncbi:MAG: hypothetical protein K5686_10015 [Lachnospiraceae bacterium]|nr:hypothetical protein [Lachnospiraceae bacterium]
MLFIAGRECEENSMGEKKTLPCCLLQGVRKKQATITPHFMISVAAKQQGGKKQAPITPHFMISVAAKQQGRRYRQRSDVFPVFRRLNNADHGEGRQQSSEKTSIKRHRGAERSIPA